jgi:hypothetical protein
MSFARRNAEIDLGARRPLRLLYECANHDDPAPDRLAVQGASNMFESEFPKGQGPEGYARAIMTGGWICDRLLRLNIIRTRAAPGYAIDLKRRSSCRVSIVSFQ